jgi:hypothetical protein
VEKKAANRPITSEDYRTLDKMVNGVIGAIISARSVRYEEIRKERIEARKLVPTGMWQVSLDELDLPGRIHNLLLDNEIETVGDVKFNLALGDDVILNFRGLSDVSLHTIKEHLAKFEVKYAEKMAVEKAEAQEEAAIALEGSEIAEAVEIEEVEAETIEIDVVEVEAEEEEFEEEEVEVELESLDVIDDLSQSLVQDEPKPSQQKKKGVVIARQTAAEKRAEEELKAAEEEAERNRKSRSRELVFDEEIGEVVAKRKRKGSRRTQEWDDFDLDDF